VSPSIADELVEVGRQFDARGWVLGTSGNFSALVSRDPLRLAITASGAFKGRLRADQILEIDEHAGRVSGGTGRPSAEALLHVLLVRARGAGAVLHTHSIAGTVLSDRHAGDGGLAVEDFEMLKGLEGIVTHEHREWLPIVENDQDMPRLASAFETALSRHPSAHAVLIRRHGLYTWGDDLAQAVRHVEILEFLLEVLLRGGFAGLPQGADRWPS
jgi:methylthioribulose-1-phosphate dehydratase